MTKHEKQLLWMRNWRKKNPNYHREYMRMLRQDPVIKAQERERQNAAYDYKTTPDRVLARRRQGRHWEMVVAKYLGVAQLRGGK